METVAAVQMKHVTKRFGSVIANDSVSLDINKGEILSLLGENGSGKTTLMNMLAGIYFPDEGEILVNGSPVTIASPKDAYEHGIGMIHQHFKLVDVFTAAENIVLGLEHEGKLDLKSASAKITEICKKYGFHIDPSKKVYDMSVSEKQTVEIVKVLYRGAEILILDEPTAVLTPQETDRLFAVMRNMRSDGKAMVIITHKLHEVMDVSDRVAVLRKGKYIGDVPTASTNPQSLTDMMVGRAVTLNIDRPEPQNPTPRLEVQNVTVYDAMGVKRLDQVSFTAMGGEILGIAGIEGNGQTEFVYGLTGLEKFNSGKVLLDGKEITNESIRQRSKDGMSHIPEDRHKHGLVLDYSLENNMVLQRYWQPEFQHNGFIRSEKVREYSDKLIAQYDVRSGQGSATIVRSMSGGNQQKAIIAREIDKDPKLLVAVQPTRGLDVGAIEYIHKQIVDERDRGKAVLLVSLELDEVMNLSDRILVMYEGEIVGEFDPKTTTVQELGLYMAGARKQGKE
mgnify:CR=1 FL=1